MRTHRTLMVIALVLAVLTALAGVSSAQCGGHGQRDGRMGQGGEALQPAFTTAQQEQIEKIRTKYQDQRVELYNKIGVIRLEMRDLLSQPEPDFTKVETKIDEMSAIHAKLAKMRLQQHKEIRGILTAEQRTLFDRGFAEGCCGGPGGPGGGQMGCCGKMGDGGAMGCKMGGGAMGCAGKMGAAGAAGCGGAKGCGGAMGCAAMGAGSGTASCPMAGGAGPMRGMKPQAREWRRWL